MKIRVYYNLYNGENSDYETLTTICSKEELPEVLTWLQVSFYTEFLTLEVIPS